MYGVVARPLLLITRHYLAVPPDPHLLFMILSSQIIASGRGTLGEPAATFPGGAPGTGTFQFEFGVDPTFDSELAMVRFQIKTTFPLSRT